MERVLVYYIQDAALLLPIQELILYHNFMPLVHSNCGIHFIYSITLDLLFTFNVFKNMNSMIFAYRLITCFSCRIRVFVSGFGVVGSGCTLKIFLVFFKYFHFLS